MNQEIEIIKAIADHLGLGPEELDRHASLRDDLALGPLEFNDLLEDLKDKFKVTFEPDEVSNIKTINDLVSLVEDNLIA